VVAARVARRVVDGSAAAPGAAERTEGYIPPGNQTV